MRRMVCCGTVLLTACAALCDWVTYKSEEITFNAQGDTSLVVSYDQPGLQVSDRRSFVYDAQHRLTTDTLACWDDSVQAFLAQTYGVRSYDAQGRLQRISYYEDLGNDTLEEAWRIRYYYGVGDLADSSMDWMIWPPDTFLDGKVYYTYDAYGRVAEEVRYQGDLQGGPLWPSSVWRTSYTLDGEPDTVWRSSWHGDSAGADSSLYYIASFSYSLQGRLDTLNEYLRDRQSGLWGPSVRAVVTYAGERATRLWQDYSEPQKARQPHAERRSPPGPTARWRAPRVTYDLLGRRTQGRSGRLGHCGVLFGRDAMGPVRRSVDVR